MDKILEYIASTLSTGAESKATDLNVINNSITTIPRILNVFDAFSTIGCYHAINLPIAPKPENPIVH